MPFPPQPPARTNSDIRRDPALDGLRGIAILLVFLFHYGGGLRSHNPLARAVGYLTQAGWIGVDLFFALSGFLITGLLIEDLRAPHALRNFYARRALRILPLYVAALLACAVAALLSGAGSAALKPLFLYAAFLQNLPPFLNASLRTPPPLPVFHLWSLAVEEQFYLLWPLALLAARTPRRAFHLCLWTFTLSCIFRALIFFPHLLTQAQSLSFAVFLPTRAGALALGGSLALYRRLHPTADLLKPALTGAALGAGVYLATGALAHTLLLNNPAAFGVGLPAVDLFTAAVVALTLRSRVLRPALSTPVLSFLGRISYGFYVLHILLEPLFDRLGAIFTHQTAGFAYQTVRLLAAFPVTVAAAFLSFTLLESPFLRLKSRFPRSVCPPDQS